MLGLWAPDRRNDGRYPGIVALAAPSPSRTTPAERLQRFAPWVLAVALAGRALVNAGTLVDPDGPWHRRTGELILDTGRIPRHDPFSWTAGGADWQPNAWLADVVLALTDRLGGLTAVSLLRALGVAAFGIVLYRIARRSGAGPWASVGAAWLCTFALDPFVAERPQLFSFLLFPALLALAEPSNRLGRVRSLVGVGVVLAVWANTHGVFVVGVGVVGLQVLGRVLAARRGGSGPAVAALRREAPLVAVAVLAPLVNPFTWHVYTHAWHVRAVSSKIEEYRHLSVLDTRDQAIVVIGLGVAYGLWRTGRWRRLDVVLPLAALALMTIDAIRNGPFFLVLGAGELARSFTAAPIPRLRAAARARVSQLVLAAVIVAVVTTAASVPMLADAGTIDAETMPVRAVDAIPAGCLLFNDYDLGGLVIERRWPEVLVAQDGRNDMYGKDLLNPLLRITWNTSERPVTDELDRLRIECVLTGSGRPLAEVLSTDPGWTIAVSDPSAVLFVR